MRAWKVGALGMDEEDETSSFLGDEEKGLGARGAGGDAPGGAAADDGGDAPLVLRVKTMGRGSSEQQLRVE